MDRLRRVYNRVSNVAARLARRFARVPPPGIDAISLKVADEFTTLAHVGALSGGAGGLLPGTVADIVSPVFIHEDDLTGRLKGRVGGTNAPDWAHGAHGALRSGVSLCRMTDVYHAPRFGAVIDRKGEIARSSIQEALYFTPTLSQLPYVSAHAGAPIFQPPRDARLIKRGSVFVTWGALHNYGHFLLDTLPALESLREAGLLELFPPISPALNDWQCQLMGLVLPEKLPRYVDEDIVRIGDVVFSTCMDHFLHAPNRPMQSVRAAGLKAASSVTSGHGRRIYLSRVRDQKRRLVNELELQAALQARGFTIVSPETLSIPEQVALHREAKVVVAPTGAALANCLFMPDGAQVFELQPTNFTGIWVRNLCELLELRWYGFFCPSPIERDVVTIDGVDHADVMFDWRIDIDAFLAFLDERL